MKTTKVETTIKFDNNLTVESCIHQIGELTEWTIVTILVDDYTNYNLPIEDYEKSDEYNKAKGDIIKAKKMLSKVIKSVKFIDKFKSNIKVNYMIEDVEEVEEEEVVEKTKRAHTVKFNMWHMPSVEKPLGLCTKFFEGENNILDYFIQNDMEKFVEQIENISKKKNRKINIHFDGFLCNYINNNIVATEIFNILNKKTNVLKDYSIQLI